MYDELINRLRNLSGTDNIAEFDEAADAIEELQRQIDAWVESERTALIKSLPRWIPVTERLPGREWVLCNCRAKIHEVLSLRDGYWYHDPHHQFMSGFVTHWMPLPEPPKFDVADAPTIIPADPAEEGET